MWKVVGLFILIGALGAGWFWRASFVESESSETTTPFVLPPAIPKKIETETQVNSEQYPEPQVIELLATNWYFEPEEIRVKRGERIRLVVTGEGSAHSFSLPGLGVEFDIAPGETKTAEFSVNEVGVLTFTCSLYCGEGHAWMKGSLIVEE